VNVQRTIGDVGAHFQDFVQGEPCVLPKPRRGTDAEVVYSDAISSVISAALQVHCRIPVGFWRTLKTGQ
jgi:hypothetical protein